MADHKTMKEFYKRMQSGSPTPEEQARKTRECLMRHKYRPNTGKENLNGREK